MRLKKPATSRNTPGKRLLTYSHWRTPQSATASSRLRPSRELRNRLAATSATAPPATASFGPVPTHHRTAPARAAALQPAQVEFAAAIHSRRPVRQLPVDADDRIAPEKLLRAGKVR